MQMTYWKECFCKLLEQIRCITGDVQVVYCNRFESSSSFSIRASFCICSVVLFTVHRLFMFGGGSYWIFYRLRDSAPFSFIWIVLQSGLSLSCCTWHVLGRVILLVREDKQIWHFIRKCWCVKKKCIKARESFYFSRLELFLDNDNLNFCVE